MDRTRSSTGAGTGAITQLGRAPAAAAALLAAAAILLVAVAPAASATVDRSWRGTVGPSAANGTVTVVALTAGTGTVTLRLKALPKSAPVTVTIRAGTCAKPGSVASVLPASRSSATGAVSRTVAVGRTAVGRMKAASTLIAQVRSTGFSRCAVLRRVTTPGPSPSPSPSPSSSGEVEVHARGFAFSPATITAAAGKPIVVSFRNDDASVPHGMNVGTSVSAPPIAASGVITGVSRTTFTIPALSAGTYRFWCPVHPSMTGTLLVAGLAGASASPTASAGAGASPSASPTSQATPEPTESSDPSPSYSPY
jgi:plastocyanin